MTPEEALKISDTILEELAKKGLIVEGGWQAMRAIAIPPDAPEVQLKSMRMAYYGGAQHLFSAIMSIMDPDDEVTPKDLERMTQIHNELEAWRKEIG